MLYAAQFHSALLTADQQTVVGILYVQVQHRPSHYYLQPPQTKKFTDEVVDERSRNQEGRK